MNIQPLQPFGSLDSDLMFTFKSFGAPQAELAVVDFSVEEAASELTQIHVSLASKAGDLDLTKFVDKPGVLSLHDRYAPQPRFFHGVVAMAERGESGAHYTRYALTLLPGLHRLRYGSDCRIFQQKTVPQIVETILKENGVEEFVFRLAEPHEPREYCVQYRETHLDFVERLLAEEGIAYWFDHERDLHRLVMSDATIAAPDAAGGESLDYNGMPGGMSKGMFVRAFTWREQVTPSQVTQRDHFFRHPAHSFESAWAAGEVNGLQRKLEMYHYPGRYKADGIGAAFTKYRLEAYRDEASHGVGSGHCQLLTPGRRFALAEHPDAALNRKFFIVAASHQGVQPSALEADSGEGGTFASTSFRCIRHDTPWRPSARTKPLVEGPQMAIVAGPPGEEIYCDEFGRVKVQFPWDRYGQSDDKSSCWIRVSQNWAGGTWGHIAIPRIRQHVIVDFLEGDPDQPIITGRAYNARETVPYGLPAAKTRMTIKSKTHKGQGFNELRFEDENGVEEFWMHAQKDMNVKVLNDRNKRVDNNQTESVGVDKTIDVGNNHTETIGANQIVNVMQNMSRTIGLISTEQVGMVKNTMVGITQNVTVGDKFVLTVGKSQLILDKDGNVTLLGTKFNFNASGPVQINGKVIDLN